MFPKKCICADTVHFQLQTKRKNKNEWKRILCILAFTYVYFNEELLKDLVRHFHKKRPP